MTNDDSGRQGPESNHWDALADLIGTSKAEPTPSQEAETFAKEPPVEPVAVQHVSTTPTPTTAPAKASDQIPAGDSVFGAGICDEIDAINSQSVHEPAQPSVRPDSIQEPTAASRAESRTPSPSESIAAREKTKAVKTAAPKQKAAPKVKPAPPAAAESGFGAGLGFGGELGAAATSSFAAAEPTSEKTVEPDQPMSKPIQATQKTPTDRSIERGSESESQSESNAESGSSDRPRRSRRGGRRRGRDREGKQGADRGSKNSARSSSEASEDRPPKKRDDRPKTSRPATKPAARSESSAKSPQRTTEPAARREPKAAPAATQQPPKPSIPTPAPVAKMPPKQPSHWNKIASFLGLGGATAAPSTPEPVADAADPAVDESAPLGDSIFDAFSNDPDVVKTRASQQFVDSMFGTDSSKPLETAPPKSPELVDDIEVGSDDFVAESASDRDDLSSEEEESGRRPKRGRRRRGGRNRGRSRDQGTEKASGESAEARSDEYGRPADQDEGQNESFADFGEEDDSELEAVPMGGGEAATEGQRGRSRNIPSWLDCVSAIVETNMENHKKSGNDARPRRRRRRSNNNSNNN